MGHCNMDRHHVGQYNVSHSKVGHSKVGHLGVARPALAALALASACHAQSYIIQSTTDSTYTIMPPVSTGCGTTTGTSCTSEAMSGPASGGKSYAWGGYQEVPFGGELRAIAYTWGWSGCEFPGPCELFAEARASCEVTFNSKSTTLPPGTPVRIRSIVPVHGLIGELAPPGVKIHAQIDFVVEDDTTGALGKLIYQGSASVDPIFNPNSIEFLGNWADANTIVTPTVIPIPGAFGISGVELDALHVVKYDTVLGNKFVVRFLLAVQTSVPGPFEQLAIADFANTSSFTVEAEDPVTGLPIDVQFEQVHCYADCDRSTGLLNLDFFDYLCFINKFSAGDFSADCDANGVFDFFDFLCFQDAFVAGCP